MESNNQLHNQPNSLDAQPSLADAVLHKIEVHEVSMHSKSYFTVKLLSLILLMAAVLVLSVSLCSFILFALRQTSEAQLVGFGPRGFELFAQLFPWTLLFLDVVCIVGLEFLLRQFSFGYKSPLLYVSLILLAAIVALAVFVDQNRVDDALLMHARNQHVPLFGQLYDTDREPPSPASGLCRCVVESVQGSLLVMTEDSPFGSTTVFAVLPLNISTSSIYVGEHLFVIGNAMASGTMQVTGIDVLSPMPQ